MKIAGAVLLVAAFGWFGYSLVVSARRRERLVEALAASLVILHGEITTRLTPLPDCAALLARSGPEACRGFYTDLRAALDALGEVEFSQLWNACLSALELPQEARSALTDLGRSLGRYSADEQGAAIGRCLEELKLCAAEAREKTRQSAKLQLGLSLTAGMLLAVILY